MAFGVQYLVTGKTAFREKEEMGNERKGALMSMNSQASPWLNRAKHQNNAYARMINAMGFSDITLWRSNKQNVTSWADEEPCGILLSLRGRKILLSI